MSTIYSIVEIHRRGAFFEGSWGNLFELTQPLRN
jgi:hypothetical protein